MHKGDLGEFGLDVNKMMINNIITRRYSRSDANFQTKANELYPTSMLQIRGKCIQSKTYPAIGVMVYYEIKNNSITQVFHSQSIQGCKE